uniref:ATP synthase complex subunit 8 n=1 Tax=Gymnobelideus leadbeateri TaxID=38618 RepID=A0A7S6XW40_GYMLE|nr:ATP synthase F0 subunit 8 [Gymnobelideus leadbeateri]QOW83343.1 ATP synthase F0 subunit 8 [Gymnobelideus leadbeateri]
MPQLDTSTWYLTILLMILSLFCIFQLKVLNQTMITIMPQDSKDIHTDIKLPWEKKWTKIYLPYSSLLLS